MKGNGWKLHRVHGLGLSILVLAGATVLLSAPSAFAVEEGENPHWMEGVHYLQIDDGPQFAVTSEESIAAEGEETKRFVDRNGLTTMPVRILGMAGRGYAEGVGETVYWLDKGRPTAGSVVRGKVRGAEFPAVHEMHFHLILTTEALPGRTFRSINPAVMVNNNATAFPPPVGSRYELKNVVELEDVEQPGVVVLRILSNKNQIVGVGRSSRLGRRPHEN
jgi:hypothetical protein